MSQVKTPSVAIGPGVQVPGRSKPAIVTSRTVTSPAPRLSAAIVNCTGWPAMTRPSSATAPKLRPCAASSGILEILLFEPEPEVDLVSRVV